mgnify:CR=1 FL=1
MPGAVKSGQKSPRSRRAAPAWAVALGALVIALCGSSLAWFLLEEHQPGDAKASLAAPIEAPLANPTPRPSRASAPEPAPSPAARPPQPKRSGASPGRPALPAQAAAQPEGFAVIGEVLGTELALGPIQIEALRVEQAPAQRAAELLQGGVFSLALPRGGEWRVRATSSQASSPWTLVSVAPQATLRLTLVARVRVEGRCLGPRGEALAKVQVSFQDPGGEVSRVSSDAAGRFSARLVPGQDLLIRATKPGLASALVRIDPTEVVQGLELHLESLHKVVPGRFLGAEGRALQGALNFDPRQANPHAHASERLPFEVELDAEGRPQLEGLPGGVWVVSLPEPASDELRAWVREIDTAEEVAPVLELNPTPRGRLAGRILGASAEEDSIQVELRPESLRGGFRFLAARRPDGSGGFEFPAVPAGNYQVRATWEGGSTRVERVEVEAGAQAWVTLQPALALEAPR